VHCEEQKSVQLIVLCIVIITHTKFIKTLSIAQAISHKSQSQKDSKGLES